jgi:hypothetical protein
MQGGLVPVVLGEALGGLTTRDCGDERHWPHRDLVQRRVTPGRRFLLESSWLNRRFDRREPRLLREFSSAYRRTSPNEGSLSFPSYDPLVVLS